MVAAAVVGAVATVGGAVVSSSASSKAAKAQTKAAETASESADATIAEERRQYDQTRADYEPYRQVGYGAVSKLASMYGVTPTNADGTPATVATASGLGYSNDGGYTASPGYAFTLSEGIKAGERAASSRGILNSGGTKKALTRYAEGVASADYDTYANRIAALAGVGQTATGSTAAAGQAATTGIAAANASKGDAAIAAGNAAASSYVGTANAINGGIQNLASTYLLTRKGY